MEKPFNATFFATVAVVLPVIFLALALQSDYLARAFVASRQIDRLSKRQLIEARERKSKLRSAFSGATNQLSLWISVAGVLVMVYGVLGEILALLALEQRQATLHTQSVVMISAIVLIVAATVASLWRIVESIIESEKKAGATYSTGGDQPAAPQLEI